MIDTRSITDIHVEGVTMIDYPDFVDAFIASASWTNGEPLTDHELDNLNEDDEFVYDKVMESIR